MMIRLGVLVMLALLAGCGGGDDHDAAETETATPSAALDGPSNEPVAYDEARLARSAEGRFEAVWPSGCAGLRTRTIPSPTAPNGYAVVDLTCERDGDENRGTRVTVYDEMNDGSLPTPAAVTATIGELLSNLGVEIRKQRAIVRNGREGVAAFCGELNGPRQVWIEGFIDRGRVLVVMAWDVDDGLYTNPEIKQFFASVGLTD